MLAYKVVEKQTRHCSNWTIFKTYFGSNKREIKFKKENPEYFPRYLKNKVIKEVPNSVGILCFENKGSAELFIYYYPKCNFKIIKVDGKKQKKVYYIIEGCGNNPNSIKEFHDDKEVDLTSICRPPKGTIAFESVKVLE
jgi:cellulose synthase/poly-beta-1,6-N-acetylglucosamine synthase-like glycosyltransferase